jgi:hypothetical protein
MGKSYKKNREEFDDGGATEWIALSDIYLAESTVQKLLARDFHQIDEMRRGFENGASMVRVVLHERESGGFTIEDGRHRVIAAKLAHNGYIEAEVIGRASASFRKR